MYKPDQYPRNWRELAHACKERAGWQCEACHVQQGTKRTSQRTGSVYTVFLHAAHAILHDTGNPDPTLKALCPTCHGRHDWQLRRYAGDTLLEKLKHKLLLMSRD